MVWRIHFGAADLARTRIGMPLGPLAETQLALSLLLVAEIEYTDRQSRLPGSVWSAAEEGSPARSQLAMAALETYEKLVQPYWANISDYLQTERAARGRVLMEGGIRQLLATLQPGCIRWRPLFADETDATSVSQLLFPALADPATRSQLWVSGRRAASPLIALVGRTRAVVLRSIVDGCTITELARRAGVSAAVA
jgi:hypothetical protein